ncbi:unnamed protein product [Closterium sp. Yama58-4]|nr:unnamed protein product [Closterium sp. Yama58-4]
MTDGPGEGAHHTLLKPTFPASVVQLSGAQKSGTMAAAGWLDVTIMSARDLKDTEIFGMQDPYAVLTYGQQTHRTKTHKDGHTSPVWNTTFRLNVIHGVDEAHFAVWNENRKADDKIGTCKVNIRQAFSYPVWDTWHPLFTPKGRQQGSLRLAMKYYPPLGAPGAPAAAAAAASSHSAPPPQGYPQQHAPPPAGHAPPPAGHAPPPSGYPGYPPQGGYPGAAPAAYGAPPPGGHAPAPYGAPPPGGHAPAPYGAPPPGGHAPAPYGAPPPQGYPPAGHAPAPYGAPPHGYPPQGYPPQGYPGYGAPPPAHGGHAPHQVHHAPKPAVVVVHGHGHHHHHHKRKFKGFLGKRKGFFGKRKGFLGKRKGFFKGKGFF